MGFRDGAVVWYGPIEKYPPNRALDEVALNSADVESFRRQLNEDPRSKGLLSP